MDKYGVGRRNGRGRAEEKQERVSYDTEGKERGKRKREGYIL